MHDFLRFLALVFCHHVRVAFSPLLQLTSDDDEEEEAEDEEEEEEVVVV